MKLALYVIKKVRNQIKGPKEIHSNIKYWECIICQNNKFPFSNVEDNELTKSSFNSNFCRCGHTGLASKF